jgi:hypothetical protein
MIFHNGFLHVDLVMKCQMPITGECLITNTASMKHFLFRQFFFPYSTTVPVKQGYHTLSMPSTAIHFIYIAGSPI